MAVRLALKQGYMMGPSPLLNSIFMSTVNTAAKTLVAVASSAAVVEGEEWKPVDHFRYILMLMIWFTLWVLRVMMDHFPCSIISSPPAILDNIASGGLLSSSPSPSLSLALHDGFGHGEPDGSSDKAIGRALSHIFKLLNEIPATSMKYQFAVGMADRIVDENLREGDESLREINRTALSDAFARTSKLLYHTLQAMQQGGRREAATWPASLFQVLPLGSHLLSYFKSILGLFPFTTNSKQNQLAIAGEVTGVAGDSVMAEKLAHELVWITSKLSFCSAVEEAVVQWSFASGLSSLSLTAHPRVQSSIVKISAILLREVAQGEFEASRQVKFRLLILWLPLFCYASNGLTYPVMTGSEKDEMERVMEDVILSLPPSDQEVILANWLQDFTISSSDWPNLQRCYDKWCRSSRKLLQ
ncbi:BTB/POZ domain-containing protein At5g60050-like [Tasmannia lanceolata]|uniref:BTB/POZ domain-containing protein At5g60050-like n=1 Tax=Tasmannia lanceolata TaxID=3420 RepID=UPI004063516B